jgi:hypothetical protein
MHKWGICLACAEKLNKGKTVEFMTGISWKKRHSVLRRLNPPPSLCAGVDREGVRTLSPAERDYFSNTNFFVMINSPA